MAISNQFDCSKFSVEVFLARNHLKGFVTWTLECVTLGSFFQITLLQAEIYPRHTKEQEKYRSYMFYVSIFQRFLTFVLYNYTLQLQGKNGQNKPKNPQN